MRSTAQWRLPTRRETENGKLKWNVLSCSLSLACSTLIQMQRFRINEMWQCFCRCVALTLTLNTHSNTICNLCCTVPNDLQPCAVHWQTNDNSNNEFKYKCVIFLPCRIAQNDDSSQIIVAFRPQILKQIGAQTVQCSPFSIHCSGSYAPTLSHPPTHSNEWPNLELFAFDRNFNRNHANALTHTHKTRLTHTHITSWDNCDDRIGRCVFRCRSYLILCLNPSSGR